MGRLVGVEPTHAGATIQCVNHFTKAAMKTGNFLSSQPVTRQVLSASGCLTTVFGMGTGGTIQASSPDIYERTSVLSKLYRRNYFVTTF